MEGHKLQCVSKGTIEGNNGTDHNCKGGFKRLSGGVDVVDGLNIALHLRSGAKQVNNTVPHNAALATSSVSTAGRMVYSGSNTFYCLHNLIII